MGSLGVQVLPAEWHVSLGWNHTAPQFSVRMCISWTLCSASVWIDYSWCMNLIFVVRLTVVDKSPFIVYWTHSHLDCHFRSWTFLFHEKQKNHSDLHQTCWHIRFVCESLTSWLIVVFSIFFIENFISVERNILSGTYYRDFCVRVMSLFFNNPL